jgi:triosephosphate isomerase (TIM)
MIDRCDNKQFYVVANWKLNQPIDCIDKWLYDFNSLFENINNINVVICPSFVSLESLCKKYNSVNVNIGAQNLSNKLKGSFTGEVSAFDLSTIGVKYVILGHSERRIYYGETDALIIEKIQMSLQNNITPIVCLGEQTNSINEEFVIDQIDYYLSNIDNKYINNIIFTYEPLFSIGQKTIINTDYLNKMIDLIREKIYSHIGDSAENVIIQYGGSITNSNIIDLISNSKVNGLLIGRSSIDVYEFIDILKLICNYNIN